MSIHSYPQFILPYHFPDLSGQLLCQICPGQTPFPVNPDSGRTVDPAFISKAHIILDRDDAQLRPAAHNQTDKGLAQIFLRSCLVAEVISGKLPFLLGNAFPPSGQSFIVMGSCICHRIFRIIMGQIIIGAAGIPGIKGKF